MLSKIHAKHAENHNITLSTLNVENFYPKKLLIANLI